MCLAVDGTQILGLVNGKSHISPVPSLLLSTISALLLASLFVHRTSFVSHPIIPSQLIALPKLHCAAESGCALGAGICAAMVQGILDPQIQSWGYNSLLAPHPHCVRLFAICDMRLPVILQLSHTNLHKPLSDSASRVPHRCVVLGSLIRMHSPEAASVVIQQVCSAFTAHIMCPNLVVSGRYYDDSNEVLPNAS